MGMTLLILALASGGTVRASEADPPRSFPRHVRTVDHEELDLLRIVERKTLIVVTLKATWCPVCKTQLERLAKRLPELERCGATFLVLSPGPSAALRAIRDETGFDYPFVEDVHLKIAKRLGLQLGEKEILPAILILNEDLSVRWLQRGRNGLSYGDDALLRRLSCDSWI